jgi:chromosome segregation ATPase
MTKEQIAKIREQYKEAKKLVNWETSNNLTWFLANVPALLITLEAETARADAAQQLQDDMVARYNELLADRDRWKAKYEEASSEVYAVQEMKYDLQLRLEKAERRTEALERAAEGDCLLCANKCNRTFDSPPCAGWQFDEARFAGLGVC